jgi:hypothetical protein
VSIYDAANLHTCSACGCRLDKYGNCPWCPNSRVTWERDVQRVYYPGEDQPRTYVSDYHGPMLQDV